MAEKGTVKGKDGKENIAVILYGRGGSLGDFGIFAKQLEEKLAKEYKTIVLKYIDRDYDFFKVLDDVNHSSQSISELHIFSHSIGAGLFLAYGDQSLQGKRFALIKKALKDGRNVTYEEVVRIEEGTVQTDDFFRPKYIGKSSLYASKFDKDGFIKMWGCNSGVSNWRYSDPYGDYYWRALNEKHTPKPSIAQKFANYFKVRVYGARSGSSIHVQSGGSWISSQKYKDSMGSWPSGALPHRLVPDKGEYYEYKPQ